jgi:hypothetical protein
MYISIFMKWLACSFKFYIKACNPSVKSSKPFNCSLLNGLSFNNGLSINSNSLIWPMRSYVNRLLLPPIHFASRFCLLSFSNSNIIFLSRWTSGLSLNLTNSLLHGLLMSFITLAAMFLPPLSEVST